jgi:adenylate cyclase
MPGALALPLRRLRRLLRPGKGALVATGLALTAALALLLVLEPAPLRTAELGTYDLLLGARPAPAPSGEVVLVGVDDESLAARGQWPWPRYRLAMLVERLQQAGAAVVALDFLLAEPDRSSPEVIRAERARDGVDAGAAPPGAEDGNTRRLAAALARGTTVLAYQLAFPDGKVAGAEPVPPAPPALVVTGAPGSAEGWPAPSGAIRSLPALTAAATAEGFANAVKDADGTLRRTPLLLAAGDRALPSLALATLLLASTDRQVRRIREGGETSLVWGSRRIPVDRAGNLLLELPRAPGLFPFHSARAVLDGAVPAERLRGKIVLVGAWATGMGDLHLVPSGRWARGLEIHASVIDTLRSGRFVARPGWARAAELVAVLLLGVASSVLLSRSGFKLSLGFVSAGSLGCALGAARLLAATGLYLSPLVPALTPIVLSTVLSLMKYGIEARKVEEGVRDLIQAQDEIIVSMSVLSEARDRETGLHVLRTKRYVEILARQLATTPRYRHLGESSIALLAKSAPLHDIGKVGIADDILRKPGRLSADEYAVMKAHTSIGANALTEIVDATGHPEKNEFLTYAREMTVSHHERWDGTGYPRGLRGEEIPLAGRLMALADVYDALVSRRTYKEAFTHEQARGYIREQAGAQFDPEVVAAFLARDREFLEVARTFAEAADADALRRVEEPGARGS